MAPKGSNRGRARRIACTSQRDRPRFERCESALSSSYTTVFHHIFIYIHIYSYIFIYIHIYVRTKYKCENYMNIDNAYKFAKLLSLVQ
jgi:hypothetical protein